MCTDFTCDFDGSLSSDPDGTIGSYAWDFGDGATATGETTSHTYAVADTYTVTLTVTDNKLATDSDHAIRDGAGRSARRHRVPQRVVVVGNASQAVVGVPADVQAGDALLLFVSSATAGTPTPPAGWTLVNATTTDVLRSSVYSRIADGSEAATNVTIELGAFSKNSAVLAAYTGVDPEPRSHKPSRR